MVFHTILVLRAGLGAFEVYCGCTCGGGDGGEEVNLKLKEREQTVIALKE
jgi:hypothetical protein